VFSYVCEAVEASGVVAALSSHYQPLDRPLSPRERNESRIAPRKALNLERLRRNMGTPCFVAEQS
jgi:hypothetical protein